MLQLHKEKLKEKTDKLKITDLDKLETFLKEYDRLSKVSYTKSRTTLKDIACECLHQSCASKTQQYSHLLQNNGILSNLVSDVKKNELKQLRVEPIYKWNVIEQSFPRIEYKNVSINQVFAAKLFCNTHDNNIFSPIEQSAPDFTTYEAQMLTTYKCVCLELRQKLDNSYFHETDFKNMQLHQKIVMKNSSLKLRSYLETEFFIPFRLKFKHGSKKEQELINGICDLKKDIENEINNQYNDRKFEFIVRKIAQLPIAACSMLSSGKKYLNPDDKPPYFLHVIPYGGSTYVILGKNVTWSDDWIDDLFKNFNSMNESIIQEFISSAILNFCVNWCSSVGFYDNLSDEKKHYLNIAFSPEMEYILKTRTINLFI